MPKKQPYKKGGQTLESTQSRQTVGAGRTAKFVNPKQSSEYQGFPRGGEAQLMNNTSTIIRAKKKRIVPSPIPNLALDKFHGGKKK